MCKSDKDLKCKRCLGISYCSETCQKNDWPLHKLVCKAFAETATDAARPSENHVRALMFPVGQNRPHFVWIQGDGNHEMRNVLRCSEIGIMGPFRRNSIRKYNLNHMLMMQHDDFFAMNGSPANKSIAIAARAAQVYLTYPLRGPFIVLKYTFQEDLLDCTPSSLRHAIDIFQGYGTDHKRERIDVHNPKSGPGPRISAVQISCEGEIDERRGLRFCTVHVPLNHPLYSRGDQGDLSPLSQRLGMPLRFWKEDPHRQGYSSGLERTSRSNLVATFMLLKMDAESDEWGWAPATWQDSPGNVLVFRDDRLDISPEILSDMWNFMSMELWPMMEMAKQAEDLDVWPDKVPSEHWLKSKITDFVTWDNLMRWKRAYHEKKVGERAQVYNRLYLHKGLLQVVSRLKQWGVDTSF